MKYAYNDMGELVSAQDAVKGIRYICPYCGEPNLTPVPVTVYTPYFKHPSISDRTPLQRTCPEYHDNEYGSITNPSQKLYILNGGVPIYLQVYNNTYSLKAVFPQLSEQSMSFLREKRAKLHIGKSKITKNISDYIEYTIDDFTSKWINVSLTIPCSIFEIKSKWLCGIQGLSDINNTFFRCSENGGARLPRNSRIYIGTRYYLISSSDLLTRGFKNKEEGYYNDGVFLKLVGNLKNNSTNHWYAQNYNVYEFVIERNTKTSQSFIFSRYYTLCEAKSCITPLWPPAVIEGNQLTYSKDSEAFFYKKSPGDERVGYDCANISSGAIRISNDSGVVIKINPSAWYCLYTNFKENVNSSNSIERNVIQWFISTRRKTVDEFEPIFEIHDESGNVIHPGEITGIYDSVITSFNVPANIIIKQGEWIKAKTKGLVSKDDFYNSVIRLDACGYGAKFYDFSKKKEKYVGDMDNKDWKAVAVDIYKLQCSPMVPIDHSVVIFYSLVPPSEHKLKGIMARWIHSGQIPLAVSNYIYRFYKDSEDI